MEHLTKVLLEKREQLLQIKQFIASDRSVEQKGILRTSYSCGSCQYYLRTEENESRYPRGQYLHKNDMDIARKIAQRDYNQKMLKEIEKQLKIVEKAILQLQNNKFGRDLQERERGKTKTTAPIGSANRGLCETMGGYYL